jgi:hypothetical protein
VRKLYLPLGGRHFWSRHAYELAYASQRETKFDRALRRARKLRLSLGGDPADDEYPEKPPRMRWATYNRLINRLVAADVCRAAAMPNGRCKVHGGKSTGPRTPKGLERSRRANWKHGYYSREAKAGRSRVRAAMLVLRYYGRACGRQCLCSAICAARSKAWRSGGRIRTTPDHLPHRHRCQWQGHEGFRAQAVQGSDLTAR